MKVWAPFQVGAPVKVPDSAPPAIEAPALNVCKPENVGVPLNVPARDPAAHRQSSGGPTIVELLKVNVESPTNAPALLIWTCVFDPPVSCAAAKTVCH